MENIDITSSEFSLGNIANLGESINLFNSKGGGMEENDSIMYMYVGVAILIGIVGMLIYKFYFNKKPSVHFDEENVDCTGGFCTMGTQQQQQVE
jgi:hypothetical protein